MRLTALITIGLAAAVLAGCIDSPRPAGETAPGIESPTHSVTTTTTTGIAGSSPPDQNASFVPFAVWSGCRGMRIGIPGLSDTFDFDPAPPGWESDNPTTEFDLRFFTCDRVSWGPFERGPIHMLVELGGSYENPVKCGGENATLMRDMAAWWFSDADVASYAATAYGIDAQFTQFTVDRQEQGGVMDQTWEWGDAGARSRARFVDADTSSSLTTHITRIFWFVGDGVYAMDWTQEWQFPVGSMQGSGFRPVTGRLEDPMLYSMTSDFNDFVGRADRYEGMSLSANFVRFGDYACEQPI